MGLRYRHPIGGGGAIGVPTVRAARRSAMGATAVRPFKAEFFGPEAFATASITLDDATITATATALAQATASITLDDATTSATAVAPTVASGTEVLDDATITATATALAQATASITLDDATITGIGVAGPTTSTGSLTPLYPIAWPLYPDDRPKPKPIPKRKKKKKKKAEPAAPPPRVLAFASLDLDDCGMQATISVRAKATATIKLEDCSFVANARASAIAACIVDLDACENLSELERMREPNRLARMARTLRVSTRVLDLLGHAR